ncbi:hypothetical protein ACFPM3_27440 [Streptomyces coeruleoprunus]|uniref:Uncharacterized protein n=1 Tax=Streptomyces coeruleoprunus TaxID=285563 RepID=A0ABV9XMV2_9ACTN
MNATSTGALLLCRADPDAVAAPAHLLRELVLLAPAGDGWSVLVPEGRPWLDAREPVDRVAAGWATALAVGAPWPVLALWWDADRAGYTLASGFRRPVGYTWLTDGTPVGEDEAMLTFADRLGLDPVLDVQDLQPLTRPDKDADARARLLALTAVLARLGLALPPGAQPGEAATRLREAAHAVAGAEEIEGHGWRDAVRAELDVVEAGHLGTWLRGPRARRLATAQLAVGVPILVWALLRRTRSSGWATAGALLIAQGAFGLAYDRLRGHTPPRSAPPAG